MLLVAALLSACQPRTGTEVIVAGTATAGTPGEAVWLNFKRQAEAASAGGIQVRALIYGQLGSEEQLLSGLRRSRIHYANLSAQVVSTVVPELTLLYAPFLFDSADQADYLYDRYLTDIYRGLLAARGLHLVTWYEIGFHDVYSRTPLIVPADARGRRFRIASSTSAKLFAEAIGADVIPLGFGDIVPSLQTGLIEAGENSMTLYARTGIAGEAPHLTRTDHLLGMSVILASGKWWDALSADQRRILTESFPPIASTRKIVRAETAADFAAAGSLGITLHELTPDQRALWQRATAGVTDAIIAGSGGRSAEIHALILRGKEEYRRLQQEQPASAAVEHE